MRWVWVSGVGGVLLGVGKAILGRATIHLLKTYHVHIT